MVWWGLLGGPGAVALGFRFREEAGSSWGPGRLGWADCMSRMLDSSPSLVEFVFLPTPVRTFKVSFLKSFKFLVQRASTAWQHYLRRRR